MPKYKNTPQNRKLGRVGETYKRGRSKKKKSTKRAKTRSKRKKSTKKYKNNAQNRNLGRVGEFHGTRVHCATWK